MARIRVNCGCEDAPCCGCEEYVLTGEDALEAECPHCGDPSCMSCEAADMYDPDPGDMDGDHETGLASAGFGTDEDYYPDTPFGEALDAGCDDFF